jgi:hypothetical protein
MTNKLTLALDSNVVKRAKRYALQRNVSLSKLVEFYFSSLTAETNENCKALSPITSSLSGLVKSKDINEKEVLTDSLIKKFLWKKFSLLRISLSIQSLTENRTPNIQMWYWVVANKMNLRGLPQALS